MLGRVLAAAPHREALPAELVTGVFAEEDEPVLVRVAVPGAGAGADSWDLWPSLGHPLRTSLELVVVAPLVGEIDRDLAPPAEKIGLSLHRPPAATRAAAGTAPAVTDGAAPGTSAAPDASGRSGRRQGGRSGAADGTAPAAAGSTGPDGRPTGQRWNGVRITETVSPREAGKP